MGRAWTMAAAMAVLLLSGCGYNAMQSADERMYAIKARFKHFAGRELTGKGSSRFQRR